MHAQLKCVFFHIFMFRFITLLTLDKHGHRNFAVIVSRVVLTVMDQDLVTVLLFHKQLKGAAVEAPTVSAL